MVARLAGFGVFCLILIASCLPSALRAEEPKLAPEVPNSKYQFLGQITSNAVQIRSGPGENYYATMKLDEGKQVTVVGIKYDWLKIVPPPGSFSVVAKAFI